MVHSKEQDLAAELFLSFKRGYEDGSCRRMKRKEFVEHATRRDLAEAYEFGYVRGEEARAHHLNRAMDEYGYDAQLGILRLIEAARAAFGPGELLDMAVELNGDRVEILVDPTDDVWTTEASVAVVRGNDDPERVSVPSERGSIHVALTRLESRVREVWG